MEYCMFSFVFLSQPETEKIKAQELQQKEELSQPTVFILMYK